MNIDASNLCGERTADDELQDLQEHNERLSARVDMAEMRVKVLERDNAIAIEALRRLSKANMSPFAKVAAEALGQLVTI